MFQKLLELLPIEWLASQAMDMAERVIDNAVKGEDLPALAVKIVQLGYIAVIIFSPELVAQDKTKIADDGVETFLSLCRDTATEGNFYLPSLA